MPHPKFFLIGAQKCATSWAFNCLASHPEIFLPGPKCEECYLGGRKYRELGPAWYEARFAGATQGQLLGDASVEYIFDRTSARTLSDADPNAKAVAILRDPIERAISAHSWLVRQGKLPAEDINSALRRGLSGSGRASGANETAYVELIARGLYQGQLDAYSRVFPPSSIHVERFESISADPQSALARAYRFLGVDPSFVPLVVHRRPKAAGPLPRRLSMGPKVGADHSMGRVLKKAGRAGREVLAMVGFRRTPVKLEESLFEELRATFAETYVLLERIQSQLEAPKHPL